MRKTILFTCFLLVGSLIKLHAQSVNPSKTTYAPNETITINFSNGPGNAKDWIGIYHQGDTPGLVSSIDWLYVNGQKSATKKLKNGTVTFSAGLPNTGTYKVYFLQNDGYTILASSSFTIGTETPTCTPIPQSGWSLQYVDSQETSGENGVATNAFDGDTSTIWHTEWNASQPTHPHEIQINLNGVYDVCELKYLPRQTGTNGTIADYQIYVSDTPSNWGTAVATGTFASNQTEKTVGFPKKQGQYVRLVATSDINGGNYTSAAEINIGGTLIQAGAPVANFTSNTTSIISGQQISFTDSSTNNPTSWNWAFEGGTPATSTAQNPVVTYTTEGTYNVTLTASNTTGSHTITKTGYVTVRNTNSLKVLQFNIWQEGTSVPNGMTYIRDVIANVNPDIVCFSEVRNYTGDWTTKIVNNLAAIGLNYHRGYAYGDVSIISKYPITSSGTNLGAISIFEVDVNGQSVVVATAHLDYTYYANYLPRGYNCGGSSPYSGWSKIGAANQDPQPVTDPAIIAEQNLGSRRDEQIAAFINHVKNETRPVILVGDFNEPSHLDWTARQANMFDHHGVVFPWHTTKTLENNGFVDAFREVYPDEVANPGITWPSVATGVGSTSWTPEADERDRIDYIFYRGATLSATSAALVGPKASYVNNVSSTANTQNDTFEADLLSWPSDHKGVSAVINLSANTAARTFETTDNTSQTNNTFSIYPNPTKGMVNIKCEDCAPFSYTVRNFLGETILQQTATQNNMSINLKSVPKGLYFVAIKTKEKTVTYKIIKE
ncbi:discoidin domain-containing protein [Tenacibaculum caenipelagi]|uniref:Putative secreted protein (Por secretion system target) n=1 Tax=Tenacibaculum caenipelagi TaxID=1325435 RepID=A0A4R6TAG4_9FLAO|nr:discoidin domain-containing protein [Tenacibaculum caenipelagi]TDQ23886.1 putative secreted protein (Por secretion system target) [Tenacibaculum caenipelagi]